VPSGRPRRLALALLAVTAAVALAGCGRLGAAAEPAGSSTFDPLTVRIPPSPIDAATPPEPGLLRIAGAPSLAMGLVRVAGAEGQFAREGIGVRLVGADDAAAAAALVAAGETDLAVLPTEQALALGEAGADVRIILLLTSSKTEDAIVAAADAGIEDPAALAGRRVAYRAGAGGELVLRDALAEAGLGMGDVEAIAVDGADPAAMLARGDADAAVVSGPEARRAIEGDSGLVLVRAAGERPGLVSEVLVARTDVAEARPGQLLALVRAWQDIYLIDRDEPERIGARVGTIQGADPQEALRALEGTAIYDVPQNAVELFPGGEYHDAVIGRVAELAAAAGWIAPLADPQALIDGVYAQTVATAS
jgi:NitT/TauT family transport system substrate-binding protein